MEDLLILVIEAENQQQHLATWFNSISTRGTNSARFEDTTTFKVADLKTHHMGHPQMINSSNLAFTTSSKLAMEDLVEDAASGDVFLEEPQMHPVSQKTMGCEESDNQEKHKNHLRKEDNEIKSECFHECEQKIFEKQNKNCEEGLKCASMLPFENFMGIMVSIEGLKVDRQEARQCKGS
ncbi:hypothetical protein PIB30_037817 [Stylosanthes scabra]|uniref:Uncharacterized protein n=1 Tax=Stylosanthes scabra TaxID=79078 RepID=A0ABU6RDY2_9FABA|nr:hypothetical protein [Stylosanthes scabra]